MLIALAKVSSVDGVAVTVICFFMMIMFLLLLLTFFCLDAKESNKEKIKAYATWLKKWLHSAVLKKLTMIIAASVSSAII
jgi:hypothetical protein